MTEEHKAALARGRKESRIVKRYLEAIAARKPGRPVTPERLKQRIASLEEKIASAEDPLKSLELRQARLDAEAALSRVESAVDVGDAEADFVEVAKAFSERKGISYGAWREQGVPAAVLSKAGIPRTRS
jgi:hypothetical protein